MANKHILNPCPLSGQSIIIADTMSWTHPMSKTLYAKCPNCNNMVAVNKKNGMLRKHNDSFVNIMIKQPTEVVVTSPSSEILADEGLPTFQF